MLIAIIGPTCAGKTEVVKYLINHHNFRPAFLSTKDVKQLDKKYQELIPLLTNSSSKETNSIKPYIFDDASKLLDHATLNWRDNIVTMDLINKKDLEIGFDKRPFFLMIGIDAPISLRWKRSTNKSNLENSQIQSIQEFIELDDSNLYGNSNSFLANGQISNSSTTSKTLLNPTPSTPFSMGKSAMFHVVQGNGISISKNSSLRDLMQSCTLVVQNNFSSISALHSHLSQLHLSSSHRLRPSWDTYFLSLARLAAMRSNCMKRRVGCVLVRNKRVVATGYNGTPRGLINCAEGGCARCNGATAGGYGLDSCMCLHAEENALLECGRNAGAALGSNLSLYCNLCPCTTCAVKIVQFDVHEVIYESSYSHDDNSREIFKKAGIIVRQYSLEM